MVIVCPHPGGTGPPYPSPLPWNQLGADPKASPPFASPVASASEPPAAYGPLSGSGTLDRIMGAGRERQMELA